MSFRNCNLFKRGFTNQGMGFTFNHEKEEILMKEEYQSHHRKTFFSNNNLSPAKMKSASYKHSLIVLIENNAEEIEQYEGTKAPHNTKGLPEYKPRKISVTLHNPKEPADMRSKHFKIPLGQASTVYITPKARKVDDTGKQLKESERNCRLDEDTETLEIFNVYSRTACLLECKLKESKRKCGCIPWNYPASLNKDVRR